MIAAQKGSNEQESKGFVRGLSVSCRIDREAGGDDIVVLHISGRITEQEVGTIRDVIDAETSAVAIDLKNVDLVDREVVKFFAQSELNGTVLRNCSPYIREWITRQQTEMTEARGEVEDA